MLKLIILILVLAIIGVSIWFLEQRKAVPIPVPELTIPKAQQPVGYELAEEITTPDGFINTDKISVKEWIGKKIVLVDFWTYSCINCQRTIPHLNAWYDKYRDGGLVIIGIHTPEFEFEKKYENVEAAVKKFGIKYPVVLDNDYSTWTAYRNRYWPHKYLIDLNGRIVYDHVGEGAYEETEKKIQELLGVTNETVRPAAAPPVRGATTPEIYFGSARNTYLDTLFNLVGDWDVQPEHAENKTAGAKITLRYKASNVYMVASANKPVAIKIYRDGQLQNSLTIRADELYSLVEDSVFGEHTLEVIIEQPGLRAFTFTFG